MNLSYQQKYVQLVGLLKLYLFQEYSDCMQNSTTKPTAQRQQENKQKAPVQAVKTQEAPPSIPKPIEEKRQPVKKPPEQKPQPAKKPSEEKIVRSTSPTTHVLEHDIGDFRKILSERFPTQKIHDAIPTEELANQKQKNATTTSVIVLSIGCNQEEQLMLSNLAKGIESHLAYTTKHIHIPEQSDKELFLSKELRLVITTESSLSAVPEASSIDRSKIHLLPDLTCYFKEPQLKSKLWSELKAKLNAA